jgi:hypothetical protein
MYNILSVLIIFIALSSYSIAKCINQTHLSGRAIKTLGLNKYRKVFVDFNGKYKELTQKTTLSSNKHYHIQTQDDDDKILNELLDENYLEYYDYSKMAQYISSIKNKLHQFNYKVETVGKSVQGRNLFGISPTLIDPEKKTIIIFGRQHGDEGTANYIIEGFLNKIFTNINQDWHNKFQVIIYPMINPDGADNRTRYNANGRDLNREWTQSYIRKNDEIFYISNHLTPYLKSIKNIVLSLDMHGSFHEDFIYQVDQNFISIDFFLNQAKFIDILGDYDQWQNGNAKISNGKDNMARVRLINDYSINTLTHETIRDIPIDENRTIETLKNQGIDIYNTINNIY